MRKRKERAIRQGLTFGTPKPWRQHRLTWRSIGDKGAGGKRQRFGGEWGEEAREREQGWGEVLKNGEKGWEVHEEVLSA
ncbi:hypothetical protein SESBI_12338 [Sesbania bispinosa]|nr:hypothetical protein SESBI_12338 [Sesbania bispinosa]